MFSKKLPLALMLLSCLGACSASGGSGSTTGAGASAGSAGAAGQGGAGGSSGSTSGGASGSGGTVDLDSGGNPDADLGCTAVDILFVIDNSTSMRNNQEELAKAFPEFVKAMVTNLPAGTDLHVGLTTSSFEDPTNGGSSPGEVNCASMGTTQDFLQHYVTPDQGSTGENGGQGRLFQHEGQGFFATNTADDPKPLETWFTGAATSIGESGSVWEMVAAGAAYIADPANAPTNKGFIRDEGAVLVVFFLSDEVDNSPEAAQAYHDKLIPVKSACGGDACIVTGGIIKPCIASAPGNTLFGLMSSFGEVPKYADIDDPAQYSQALGDALAQVIALTCDEIPPPPR